MAQPVAQPMGDCHMGEYKYYSTLLNFSIKNKITNEKVLGFYSVFACAILHKLLRPPPRHTRLLLTPVASYTPEVALVACAIFHKQNHQPIIACPEMFRLLQSAVGMTHDLRSDLWWTIPLRILLGQFYTQKSTISTLAVKLSVSAIFTPRWTATQIIKETWIIMFLLVQYCINNYGHHQDTIDYCYLR